MVDTGKGIWRRVIGRSDQVEGAKEVDISTMSMEDMAKKCLHFYLEPHTKFLVDENYSADLKIHIFVQRIADLYFQHLKPSLWHRTCPTNDFIEKVNTLLNSSTFVPFPPLTMLYVYFSIGDKAMG